MTERSMLNFNKSNTMMLILGIFVLTLCVAPLLVQIFNLKSSSSSSLLLVKPVFAIPADQTAAVLSTWAIPSYSKDIANVASDFGGNAYFSETSTNKIGRLEPATNMITEWTLPTNSSKPAGIAFDPSSGSVYFAESSANKIGRLVVATNAITEWTLPTNSSNPGFRQISFDSGSGHVYFVENNGNKIGRLEPAKNTFTEWTLPTKSSNIQSISPSFGGIYFAESSTNKIGRLEPATNMITEWTLPTNSSKPAGIAFDPSSGSVYFAESSANKIGRLVPATNVVTEWNIGSKPLATSVTPGGSIIFIDEIGRIGRIG
jgi:streptogramin lyase